MEPNLEDCIRRRADKLDATAVVICHLLDRVAALEKIVAENARLPEPEETQPKEAVLA